MSDTTTELPALTRDDLLVTYGYVRGLNSCPVCETTPTERDYRLIAMSTPERERLCDRCTERLVGPDVVEILEAVADLARDLYPLAEQGTNEDMEFAQQIAIGAFRLMIAEFSRRFGIQDHLNPLIEAVP